MANTKMSFEFTPADMKILKRLKRDQEVAYGKCSYVSILRSAIRAVDPERKVK